MSDTISIEADLREGRIASAQKKLEATTAPSIPDKDLWLYGNWARRSGLPALTLRWLRPRVYPNSVQAPPTAAEKSEYAMGLQRLGAFSEAEKLLLEVDPQEYPAALLYRAFCRFSQWDYQSGQILLAELLSRKATLDTYTHYVARVNHAAALTSMAEAHADQELDALKEDLQREGHTLLLANVLELRAQRRLQAEAWPDVLATLDEAHRLLEKARLPDQLFIEKWRVVAQTMQSSDPKHLEQFRAKALELGHWETLRDLDFYKLKLEPDPINVNWLYWGTPYQSYRNRIRSLYAPLISNDRGGTWVSRLGSASSRVDPLQAQDEIGEVGHRLIMLLIKDFYRPLRVGEIFSELFEGRMFDIETATNRVQQTVRSARGCLTKLDWNFRLENRDGTYGLRWASDMAVLCETKPWPTSRVGIIMRALERSVPGDGFGVNLASETLNLSTSQTQRLLKEATAEGFLERFGAGKNTSYRFITR